LGEVTQMKKNDIYDINRITLVAETLPTVSVIIPTRNRSELVRKVVEDLKKKDYPREKLEIIIVDQSDVFKLLLSI